MILRESQHLAAVETIGDAIVLTMMRFADELADLADFKFPKSEGIRPAELKMAIQLVENLAAKWEPEKYTDEYVENLMRVIQAKVKGRKPKLIDREEPRGAEVVDLMERLRASLERRRPERGAKSPSESERGWGPASAEKGQRPERGAKKRSTAAPRGRAADSGRPKKAKGGGKRVA
jgi:DNA end-binding protein Ku